MKLIFAAMVATTTSSLVKLVMVFTRTVTNSKDVIYYSMKCACIIYASCLVVHQKSVYVWLLCSTVQSNYREWKCTL